MTVNSSMGNLYLIRRGRLDRVEFSRALKCLGMAFLRTNKRACAVDDGVSTGIPEFDSIQRDSVLVETDSFGRCISLTVGRREVYAKVVELTSNCVEREHNETN